MEVQLLRSMLESSRAREEHLVILRSQQALQEDAPGAPIAAAPPPPPAASAIPQRRRGVGATGGVPPPRSAPLPPPPHHHLPPPETVVARRGASSHTLHPPRAVSPPKPLVRGAGLGGGKARLESIDPSSLSNQLKDQIMGRVKLSSMRKGGGGRGSSGAGVMPGGDGELQARLQRLHRGIPTTSSATAASGSTGATAAAFVAPQHHHLYDYGGAPPTYPPSYSSSSSSYPSAYPPTFSHSHGFPTTSPDQRTLLRQRLFSASGNSKRHSGGGGIVSPAAIMASITPLPESPPLRD